MIRYYDAGHKYASHTARGTAWIGDPARGEFTPRDKRKKQKRGKRA
jgi:tyrosyl-tRNA synthetase